MQLYMQFNLALFASYLVQNKLSNQGHFPSRIASAYFGLTLARCDSFLVRSCFPECSLGDLRWCGIIGVSRDIYSPSLNKSPSQTVHGNTFHEEFSDIGPFLVIAWGSFQMTRNIRKDGVHFPIQPAGWQWNYDNLSLRRTLELPACHALFRAMYPGTSMNRLILRSPY
jgi:hypothetical protein